MIVYTNFHVQSYLFDSTTFYIRDICTCYLLKPTGAFAEAVHGSARLN